MHKVVVQLNGDGILSCPIWHKITTDNKIETILFNQHQDIISINPDLILLQCATQWYNLYDLNYDKLKCPIIASCGDASVLTNLDTVFNNLPILTKLHVEGYDYIEKYNNWCNEKSRISQVDKLIFQKLCTDRFFTLLPETLKLYDWCFCGQIYPEYDVRLKHYRNTIIRELYNRNQSVFLAGHNLKTIVPNALDMLPQSTLNEQYNKCHVVISIDAHDGTGYTSTRTIEAMLGGHCVLIYDHVGMSYLKQYIIPNVHAYYFTTVDECIALIEQVKSNKTAVDQMKQEARKLILKMGWSTGAWLQSAVDHIIS